MNCPECFNPYDHSLHEPFFLSCCHTFCVSCLNVFYLEKCPGCTEQIQFMYLNVSLLKIIPESSYDKSKSRSLTILNQTTDLIADLKLKNENRVKKNFENIQSIKTAICAQVNKRILDLIANKKKVYRIS